MAEKCLKIPDSGIMLNFPVFFDFPEFSGMDERSIHETTSIFGTAVQL